MPKAFLKNVTTVLCSTLLCAVLFAAVLAPFYPRDTAADSAVAADLSYSGAAYEKHNDIFLSVLVDTLPFFFTVTVKPNQRTTQVVCIPIYSVQNSTVALQTPLTKTGISTFLGKTVNGMVRLTPDVFRQWVDRVGGVTANTPYGYPAPAGTDQLLAGNERLHLYGRSIITIFSETDRPDRDRLLYAGELFALLLQSEWADFTKEDYLFFKENGETDISYSAFFDHTALLAACAAEVTFTAPEGVWMGEQYYLQ